MREEEGLDARVGLDGLLDLGQGEGGAGLTFHPARGGQGVPGT